MKKYLWLTAVIILVSGFCSGCFLDGTKNPQANAGGPKPSMLSVRGAQDTTSSILTNVDGKIQNLGGEGNVLLNAQVTLHGQVYQRDQQIFLKEHETKDVHFEFIEVPRVDIQPTFAIYTRPAEGAESKN
jgi:hypothetical protein